MKTLLSLLAATLLLPATLQATQIEKQPAFPGAEGFGRYVTGGRGGAVYHVTNLDDSGTGSLRWALEQSGRKTIVFDVSGTIHLESALSISKGNVTIAGQTAPGDGICVADYPFTINANNVILRYMRFRLGNKHVDQHEGDGLGGMDRENIIVDHCSVSWSVDECLSVYGSKNLTVQWCIVDQSMVNSGHSKGAHGYGGNWGGSGASYHHNLLAHHTSRTPRLGPRPGTQCDERMDLRNNVMYNWAGNGCYGGEGMNVNIVNNYYKPGPATGSSVGKRIAKVNIRTTEYCNRQVDADGNVTGNSWLPMWHVWGHYFVEGNYNSKYPEVTNDNWGQGFINQIDASGNDGTFTSVTADTIRLTEPIDYVAVTNHTAEAAYERVLDYAGASYHRDSHDNQIVYDVRNGVASYTGKGLASGFINSQDDNKPSDAGSDWSAWPTLTSTAAPTDTDGDGMPDEWESAHGLNPNDKDDGALVADDGYTYLEHYINSLVESITEGQNAGGTLQGVKEYESEEEQQTMVYEVSAQTTNGDWTFGDGSTMITFTSESGTPATTGTYYIKFSRNHDYQAAIPEGIEIYQVQVDGYMNGDTGSGYIARIGDDEFSADQYPLISRAESDHVRAYTITLSSPVSGSIILRNSGSAQSALRYYLHGRTASIIGTTSDDERNTKADVYSTDGRFVRDNVTPDQLWQLPAGIYIYRGHGIAVQ